MNPIWIIFFRMILLSLSSYLMTIVVGQVLFKVTEKILSINCAFLLCVYSSYTCITDKFLMESVKTEKLCWFLKIQHEP